LRRRGRPPKAKFTFEDEEKFESVNIGKENSIPVPFPLSPNNNILIPILLPSIKEEQKMNDNNDNNKIQQKHEMELLDYMDMEPPVKLPEGEWDIGSVADLESFLQCSFPSSPLSGEVDFSFPQGSPSNNVPDLISVGYRRSETLYLKKTDGSRYIIIFSMSFQDKDDIIYSDVFLKELQDTRKQLSSAPSVLYSLKEPPLEIANAPGLYKGEGQGYVSFVIPIGAPNSARRDQTIDAIMLFRNYLMYHIKCSKAYMHTRMRSRTEALLQVLNRAKMKEKDAEKKTMTGRTFTKK